MLYNIGTIPSSSTSRLSRWLIHNVSGNSSIIWSRLAHSSSSKYKSKYKSKPKSKVNAKGKGKSKNKYPPRNKSKDVETKPILHNKLNQSNEPSNISRSTDSFKNMSVTFGKDVTIKGNINKIIKELSDEGKMQKIKTNEDHFDRMKRLLPIRANQNIINRTISVKDDIIETFLPLEVEKIPKLHHNLDRALFSPGVHFLQDPRTRIFNFSPFLKDIINYNEFNFDSIAGFQPVSKHIELLRMAKLSKSQFYSSTSSMTSSLMQFYYLLNNFSIRNGKEINGIPMNGLMSRLPSSLIITPQGESDDGNAVYSVSSDKSCDTEILLSAMGNCLEVLLTTDETQFQKFTKSYQEETIGKEEVENELENVYNYAKYGSFLMRSQMDCYDSRLPRGSFDIKTRAACAIRYDVNNRIGSDMVVGSPEYDGKDNHYQIWKLNGEYESFEREFKDLIRSGSLLKYLFQARIGQMDGIFVAYHNIKSFFGFQYLSLEELDELFYGKITCRDETLSDKEKKDKLIDHDQLNTVLDTNGDVNLLELNDNLSSYIGESQFKMSMKIWEDLLQTIIKDLKAMKLQKHEKQIKKGNKSSSDENEGVTPFRLVMQSRYVARSKQVKMSVSVVEMTHNQLIKLDEIPQLFSTSFKDIELTSEEREMNLNRHKVHLQRFNESTVRGKNVLSYLVEINKEVINGDIKEWKKEGEEEKEYIQKVKLDDDWRIQYSISQRPNDTDKQIQINRANYLRKLSIATDSIINSPEIIRSKWKKQEEGGRDQESDHQKTDKPKSKGLTRENILKAYSKIGESRVKQWSEKDSQKVVYKPK
ncbi:mitochondrial protein Pet127-domain-containing protein [Scheffersomyces coipomensis]|uniref:mitochondrial protein Pet127-domain-containing protein n=1 Tax=Scheffersomyces coipomensis TaxID=1788519 RepID=UPI00315CBFFD